MVQIYKYYPSHPNNIIVIAQNETVNNVLVGSTGKCKISDLDGQEEQVWHARMNQR